MKNEMSYGTRPCWMIVDDNAGVLLLLSAHVAQMADVEIACFNSPQKALDAFTADPENFQLIITDLEMPGMDGIYFCRRLRAIVPQMKILLATGNRLLTRAEAMQKGFCGLLEKPFRARVMKDALVAAGLEVGWRESTASALTAA